VEKYPDALILVGENISNTPLHVLMANTSVGAMFDIVKYLVESEPMSLRHKDEPLQQLPLHVACKNQSITNEIIQYLVNKWPEALQEGNDTECTPLHLFCRYGDMISNNDAIDILKLILETYPDGARRANRSGFYPIHCAAGNKSMLIEFIQILNNANRE